MSRFPSFGQLRIGILMFLAVWFLVWGAIFPVLAEDDDSIQKPKVNECLSQKPEWIFCDDFEKSRLDQYFEYINRNDGFVRAEDVGFKKSMGMKATFAKGTVSPGDLHLAIGKTPDPYLHSVGGDKIYREIYWRMYVKNADNWIGGGGDKLMRATSIVTPNWAQAMIAHVWSGSKTNADYLVIDPASGTDTDGNVKTTQYNDFANLRWLGATRGITPIFDAQHVGKWHAVEAHVKLNDPGQSNGLFELWIDDRLEASKTGLNWLGQFEEYGINAIFFENYWNSGSPQLQERYFDNIVVSTQKIGMAEGNDD